ncbi:hypothetical protein AHF37_10047 [Paragonimus kellicotti]|nr:hypothetical protein AHF37_10047 [Paragonimus kellicotti]
MSSNLKTNSNSNPATTRFKWLCGVSKSVHSRSVTHSNFAYRCPSELFQVTQKPIAQMISNIQMTYQRTRDGKRKSFESLLSPDLQQNETSFDDHINGIGIIYTAGRRDHAVNHTDSVPDSQSSSRSVKNDLFFNHRIKLMLCVIRMKTNRCGL